MIREPQNSELNQLARGKKPADDLANNEEENWSSPFSIEDIEDFHVSFSASSNMSKDQKKYVKDLLASEIDEDDQWFDPC